MKSRYRTMKKALLLGVAALPLMQVSCSPDLLTQAFTNEIIYSAVQFSYGVSETVLLNLFAL